MNWQAIGIVVTGTMSLAAFVLAVLRFRTDRTAQKGDSALKRDELYTQREANFINQIAETQEEEQRLRDRIAALEKRVIELEHRGTDLEQTNKAQSRQIRDLEAELYRVQKGRPAP